MSKVAMFIGAHPDDEVYGAGATLYKLNNSGYKTIVIILSYGELSGILAKKDYVIRARVKEDKKAQRILNIDESYYLGLKEGHFLNEAKRREVCKRLAFLIKKFRPEIIITHGPRDLHKDHRDSFKITLDTLKRAGVKTKLYTCQNIWGWETNADRRLPKMFVDVSKEFSVKLKALREFKSQKIANFFLLWITYLRALFNGIKIGKKYAEVFYKIKYEE